MEAKNNLSKKNVSVKKGLLVFAITFLVNPCVNVFDYLPDFVGYLIIASCLTYYARRVPHFEEARTGFFRLACVSVAKIPAYFFMVMIRGQNTIDNDIKSLFTFTLTAIETILLIDAVRHLFDALAYLGQRGNATALLREFPLSKNGKRKMKPDSLRNLCYAFAIYRFAATALPEMLLLTKTVDAGSYYKVFNVARLYPYAIIFAVVSVFILGIIVTKRFSKYLMAIKAEGLMYSSVDLLFDDLSRENLNKKLMVGKIKTTLTLFLVAAFFTVDISVDNIFSIDAVPNFVFGILVLLASVRISSLASVKKYITIFAALYSIVALTAYYFQIKFLTSYGYDMLTTSLGRSDYMSVIISSGAEFVFYTILLVLSAVAVSRLAYNHTGIEKENPHYSKVDEDYHKKLTRDVWTWFTCALLAGGAKLVDTIQRYFADTTLVAVENDVGLVTSGLFPWFNIVTFGTTVLFICYSLYLFGRLKEEVALKYS